MDTFFSSTAMGSATFNSVSGIAAALMGICAACAFVAAATAILRHFLYAQKGAEDASRLIERAVHIAAFLFAVGLIFAAGPALADAFVGIQGGHDVVSGAQYFDQDSGLVNKDIDSRLLPSETPEGWRDADGGKKDG